MDGANPWRQAAAACGVRADVLVESVDVVASRLGDAAGHDGAASGLLRPTSVVEASQALQAAALVGAEVTVVGAQTGLLGGCVPARGVLLDLAGLDAEPVIHASSVEFRPGRSIGAVDDALRQRGRRLHGLPTSRDQADACGVLATAASGADSLAWGGVDDHLLAAEVLLIDGRRVVVPADAGPPVPLAGFVAGWHLASSRADAEGHWVPADPVEWPVPPGDGPRLKRSEGPRPSTPPRPTDLVGGCEGVWCIITGATLATHADTPATRLAWWVAGDAEAGALVEALQHVLEADLWAADLVTAECFELPTIQAQPPQERRGQHLVLLEIAGEAEAALERLLEAESAISAAGVDLADCEVLEGEVARRFKALREAVPAAANEWARQHRHPKTAGDWVHPGGPTAALAFIRDRLAATGWDAPGRSIVFGHLGDGNLHPNLFAEPGSADEADRLIETWSAEAAALGGAFSGEHGIGRRLTNLHERLVDGERLAWLRSVKDALDPSWRLNRGVMLQPRA